MSKKVVSYMIFISCIIIFSDIEGAYANTEPPTFEEKYSESGYKSVEDAIKEFEKHVNCDVNLPTLLPSIPFTHKFARFVEDKENNANDNLEIRFVNKDIKENIFKIDIRSLKDKLDFEGEKYTLQDGTKGIYFEHQLFNFFVFEKNDLQYMLGIYKGVANKVTPEIFVKIANSI
ncbi:carbon monoxide dehydrogenase [Lysinibacillus boronitolerans]|uniref:carbon monoxide dehydrogenase n=1 Tax=Lysinibacillus boronitolerans TaxID=309788 RepID=UPI003854BCEC